MRPGAFVVLVALAVVLTGCKIFEYDGDNPPFNFSDVVIEERLDRQPSCGCGRSVYVKNRGNSTVKATVKIVSDGPSAPRKTRTVTRTLPAGDDRFLGCTVNWPPNAPVGSRDCSYRSNYSLESSQRASLWPALKPRIVTVAFREDEALTPPITRENTGVETTLPNCRVECTDPNSRNAVCIKLSDNDINARDGLTWLAAALLGANAQGGAVAKADIMSNFSVEDDPCDRSDTAVADGKLTNTGGACRLEARVASPRGPLVSTVRMAASIEGDLYEEGDEVIADFAAEALSISFSDRLLQSQFGGEIHQIATGSYGAIATTTAGCIALTK
jgi:hypothetical protein